MFSVSANVPTNLIPIDESIEDEVLETIETHQNRVRKRQIGGGKRKIKTCVVKCEPQKVKKKRTSRKQIKKNPVKTERTKPKRTRKASKSRKSAKLVSKKPKKPKLNKTKRKKTSTVKRKRATKLF